MIKPEKFLKVTLETLKICLVRRMEGIFPNFRWQGDFRLIPLIYPWYILMIRSIIYKFINR